MAKLHPIQSEFVDNVWPEVEPMVDRCLRKIREFRWNADDIKHYLQEKEMQLWAVSDEKGLCGIIITQILVTPRARECLLFMMSGRMPDGYMDIYHQLEGWARDMQCTHITSLARPGSAKLFGMNKGLIQTSKEL